MHARIVPAARLPTPPRPRRSCVRWAWACACALALPAALALAQSSGGPYVLRRFVVAGGGVDAEGAPYAAVTTVGQAATAEQVGGSYRLRGGFHVPVPARPDRLLCDGFENTPCP